MRKSWTRLGLLLGMALAMATGAPQAAAAPKGPDLAACPLPEPEDMSWRERQKPLPVPPALAGMMRANLDFYAVATLEGGTVCIETRWMEQADDIALSTDKRFLSFGWSGYEAYGFILVDRTGQGQSVDTGARPAFSPSGARVAAVELSESGFGSLNGFAVWQVEPEGLRELARLEDLPEMYDWRIEGWSGEDCLRLSALPLDRLPEDSAEDGTAEGTTPRDGFIARSTGAMWDLSPSARGACPSR